MPDPVLTAAVAEYSLQMRRRDPHAEPIQTLYRDRLDALISVAHHWHRHDQAAALLILALAEDREGGPAECLTALKHAAARLNLPLPLGEGATPS